MIVIRMRDDDGIQPADAQAPQLLPKGSVRVPGIDEHVRGPRADEDGISLSHIQCDDLVSLRQGAEDEDSHKAEGGQGACRFEEPHGGPWPDGPEGRADGDGQADHRHRV